MLLNRREALIRLAVLLAAGAGTWTLRADAAPRMRVIIDNDFGSDPDGLVQLAHHLLSPSVDIPLIISSHLHAGENWDDFSVKSDVAAARGAEKANQLIELLGMSDRYRARPGVERAIADRQDRQQSPVTDAIVTEVLRQDVSSPLYYACGAGLTELALAWLTNPDIGKRLVLIWIGGPEHAGLPAPKRPNTT